MKKWIISSGIAVILIAGTIAGYININNVYPARVVKGVESGEELEFRDGVTIAVKNSEWLEEKEKKEIHEKIGKDLKQLEYDVEVMEVTVVLKNQTDEEKEVPMTDLYLESTGVANGIIKAIIDAEPDYYGHLIETLKPGEVKEIIYPYEMASLWFRKNEWKTVKDRDFWLTFSSYPEKTYLYL